MRIKDIEIEGYKSIEDQHFSPGDLAVLIGKNNSGKSNIIDLLQEFGEYFDKPDPGGEWFNSRLYQGGSKRISVGFHFELDDQEHNNLLHHIDNSLYSEYSDQDWLKEVRAYRNFTGGAVVNDLLVNINDVWVDAYDLEDLNYFPRYFANELKDIVLESLESWSFIAPLRDPDLRAIPARVDKMDESGTNLIRALETLRSSPKHDIYEDIVESYVDIMENVTDLRIQYDRGAGGQDKYTLFIEEKGFKNRFKATHISSGSLEILVLLTKLHMAKDETDLIAIEEPELHLHPGAEKEIFEIITDLAKDGGPQVIVSTHSEVFVDESQVDNIVLVTRDKETKLNQVEGGEFLDILGYDNSDLVQSDAVVFVEGRSDKVIFEKMAEKIGKPLQNQGIEIVVGYGDQLKSDAEPITRVLNQLGIPYQFVFDSDGMSPEEKVSKISEHDGLNPGNIQVLEEHSIESYIISSPVAIASSINEDVDVVQEFIDEQRPQSEPVAILDNLYKEFMGISYNKEKNGAQIVAHFEPSDVDDEIIGLIEGFAEMANPED